MITGLSGNNGCGKSSLMKIMFGVLQPESKSIRINGRHTPEPYKQTGAVTYMPQQCCLPPGKSVQDIFRDFNLDMDAFRTIFSVDFSPRQKVWEIHHSTKRLIEIYVITKAPSMFTMLDEPFTHISPILSEKVLAFLLEEKQNKGIIVTDHNFNYLKTIADDLFLLNNGRLKHIKKPEADCTYKSLFEI